MQFSYSLQFNAIPEWSNDYLAYGKMKKAVDSVEAAKLEEAKSKGKASGDAKVTSAVAIDMGPKSALLEGEFITLMDSELARVSAFFAAKKAVATGALNSLMEAVKDASSATGDSTSINVNEIQVWSGDDATLDKRRASLEERFDKVYLSLHDLHDYLDLNYTGFVKLVNTYSKYVNSNAQVKETMVTKIDNTLPASALDELQETISQLEDVYGKVMCNGNSKQAHAALRLLVRDRIASKKNPNAPAVAEADIVKSAPVAVQKPKAKEHKPYLTTSRITSLIGCVLIFAILLSLPYAFPENAFFKVRPMANCLALLIFASALWCTEAIPLYATAILIPLLVAVLQVIRKTEKVDDKTVFLDAIPIDKAAETIISYMFSHVILLLLGGFALAAALEKYGITRRVATVVLKKFGKTSSSMLLTVIAVTTFSSMWISNVSAPVLCFSLIQPILRNLDSSNAFAQSLILGIAFGANIGGLASPISSPQSLIASNELVNASFLKWLAVSIPTAVLGVIVTWMWLKMMFPSKETLNLKEIFGEEKDEESGFTARQIWVVIIALVTIGLWAAGKSLEKYAGPMGMLAVFPLVAYFGFGFLGKEDFNGFMWNVVFLAMGGNAIGKAVYYSDLLGFIGMSVGSYISNFHLFIIMAIFCAGLLVISTFVSHTVTAMIFVPIIKEIAKTLPGAPVNPLVITAGFTCSAGMAMPISGFPNMTAAAQEDRNGNTYVGTKEFVVGGVVPSIIFTGLIIGVAGVGTHYAL